MRTWCPRPLDDGALGLIIAYFGCNLPSICLSMSRKLISLEKQFQAGSMEAASRLSTFF